jgi:biotin carboxylase
MNNEEIWLVAVTAGRWQRHGICEAKAAGLKVIAIDADPNAEGFSDADYVINMDLSNHQAVIAELYNIKKNIQGAVSFVSDAGMILAAAIRDEFNLPGMGLGLCRRFVDKGIQRKIWHEKGVPGPKWKVFSEKNEALNAIYSFDFPFIIKPTDSSGSRGVTKIDSREDDILGAVIRAFEFSSSGEVIIETYMDGSEFTVEVFAVDGFVNVLAVTEKKKVEGTRGTVASELATPDRPQKIISKIAKTVVDAFNALDYKDGPGHAELILKKDETVGLIEVAARGGGFMVFDGLVPAVSGVNLARITAIQSVGLAIGEVIVSQKYSVLRFFPSKPGVLQAISGFEEANLIPGVKALSLVVVGDRFEFAATDGDRLGYILTYADTPKKAKDLADKAESLINFSIEVTNDY